jgi:hypothetical protein
VPVTVVTIERDHTTEIGLVVRGEDRSASELYIQAIPVRPPGCYDLLGTPAYILAEMVEHIVAVEGPVHIDEVTARVRCAWDLQRTGVRIQALVERAVLHAQQTRRINAEDQFLNIPGRRIGLRDRSTVSSASLRKPEMLPPEEIAAGAIDVVRANLGATEEQIVSAVLRLLGFKSTSSQLREVVLTTIRKLTADGILVQQGDLLIVDESSVESAKGTSQVLPVESHHADIDEANKPV